MLKSFNSTENYTERYQRKLLSQENLAFLPRNEVYPG